MVRITEKGFQGSENNTVKGPVEEASLANANGDARSGRGVLQAACRRAPGAPSFERRGESRDPRHRRDKGHH